MRDLALPPHSFDAVWSEGAIYNVGFSEGLAAWRSLVRPGGWIVVSELTWLIPVPPEEARAYWREHYARMSSLDVNLEIIHTLGLRVVEHFPLGRDAFWDEFYAPMAARVEELRARHPVEPGAAEFLAGLEREIEVYRRFGDSYSYVFYVMRLE